MKDRAGEPIDVVRRRPKSGRPSRRDAMPGALSRGFAGFPARVELGASAVAGVAENDQATASVMHRPAPTLCASDRHEVCTKTEHVDLQPANKEGSPMKSKPITVLVTGATGQQGGAAVRHLCKRGHRVRGLTRNSNSSAAKAIAQLGAEIVTGSFDDAASLKGAVEGVEAVFAMSTPNEDPGAEVRQGCALADAARSARVKHVVYSSVASADKQTGIAHFESKHKIESHLRSIDVPHTVIAPVFFMDNLCSPWLLPLLKQGKLELPIRRKRRLQMIGVDDIAAFATSVIEQPGAFLAKRIEIASDELTGEKIASILSNVSGHYIEYSQMPIEQIREFNRDFATMFEWFDTVGYGVDIPALKRRHADITWHKFDKWAKALDWDRLLS